VNVVATQSKLAIRRLRRESARSETKRDMRIREGAFDRAGAPAHDLSVMKANSAPKPSMQKSPVISDEALNGGR